MFCRAFLAAFSLDLRERQIVSFLSLSGRGRSRIGHEELGEESA